MAHFAQLNDDNKVVQVIVVNNSELMDNGAESEEKGVQFCKSLFGDGTRWKQTSYNGNFRKHYAGVGYVYDPIRDAFIPPKPYPSWVLDETTLEWKSPVPMPDDAGTGEPPIRYVWDEGVINWIMVLPEE